MDNTNKLALILKAWSSVFFFLSLIHTTYGEVECLSCTYTYAGIHGLVDRECVSEVLNFTKTSVIRCPEMCTTKAVYVRGYTRLNSLYRGCGYKKIDYCDRPSAIIPVCERSCYTNQCDDTNGDLWPQMRPRPRPRPPHPHPKPKPHGWGYNGGLMLAPSSSCSFSSLVLTMLFLCVFL